MTDQQPLSGAELAAAPAEVRHLAAMRRTGTTTTVTTHEGVYQVVIDSQRNGYRIVLDYARRRRRWVCVDASFTKDGTPYDVSGGIEAMLRLMSQGEVVDLVGSPAASTRHRGENHTLATRAHTIIRT